MTVAKLIAKLVRERDEADRVIKLLRKYTEIPAVAAKIRKTLKKKKQHWTQTPKGRKILSQRGRERWAAKSE